MQLLFGRSGSVNLLLNDAFGFTVPFMDGLNGVIFVESLHYFPFILLNLVVVAARTSTARWRSRRRTSAPRAGGCSAASSSRSRCPATSPALRWCSSRCSTTSARRSSSARTNMLAPQAYLRDHLGRHRGSDRLRDQRDHGRLLGRRAVGVGADPQGPRLRDAAARRHVAAAAPALAAGRRARLWLDRPRAAAGALAAPRHPAACRSRRCGASASCPRASRCAHYATVFTQSTRHDRQHLLYCGLAALLDVVLGTAIAYIILRTRLPGRQLLDPRRRSALAIPGVVLGDRLPARRSAASSCRSA